MTPPLVLACLDYDTASQTCVTEAWIEQPAATFLPTLSMEHAQQISLAATLAWVSVGAALLVKKAI